MLHPVISWTSMSSARICRDRESFSYPLPISSHCSAEQAVKIILFIVIWFLMHQGISKSTLLFAQKWKTKVVICCDAWGRVHFLRIIEDAQDSGNDVLSHLMASGKTISLCHIHAASSDKITFICDVFKCSFISHTWSLSGWKWAETKENARDAKTEFGKLRLFFLRN